MPIESKTASTNSRLNPSIYRHALLVGVSTAVLGLAPQVWAQDDVVDEIVVSGSRQVIQDAIALKRSSTQIVDGLIADEIGDIPALSIGEALENITGVASHR